jgi:hypothetical protein
MVTVTRADGTTMPFNQDKLAAADIAFLKQQGALSSASASAGGASFKVLPEVLPDPDGKEADVGKPVQVFVMMGQSNMVGLGATGPETRNGSLEFYCKTEKKYPYLIDDAGKQYDDDTANAKAALADIGKTYPGAKTYKIAGFVFWQGEKDCGNAVHASLYERNLVQLIRQLRKDFDAPDAKFVLATLGETAKGGKGNAGMVLDAHLAVDGATGSYPEFKGNVATVYSHPLSNGGSGNSHYNGNAGTYMNVGEAMGREMFRLLEFK